MVISHKHKALFFAVPRTASRSIAQWLLDQGDAAHFGGHHGRAAPSEFTKYFSFAVVRHPYPRAVSFYRQATSRNPDGSTSALYQACGGEQPFSTFVCWMTARRPHDPHEWKTQSHFLVGLRIDQLLYYELLIDGFYSLPFVGNHDELPWIGRSTERDWLDFYDDESIVETVRYWARDDFARFGYAADYHRTGKVMVDGWGIMDSGGEKERNNV